MTRRIKEHSGKVLATAGIMLVLGVLIWALMAFGFNAKMGTYSDATYRTAKTSFGRGVDTVYTNMTGGLGTKTYYAEYWGPSTDGGTDMVFKPAKRFGPLTSRASGGVSYDMATSSTDESGAWQARMFHNPNYTGPCRVVIDTPQPGDPGYVPWTSGTPVQIKFHLIDRDGNIVTGNNASKLRCYLAYNGSTSSPGWGAQSPSTSNGWNSDSTSTGYYYKTFTPDSPNSGRVEVRVYAYKWYSSGRETDPAGGTDDYSLAGGTTTTGPQYERAYWSVSGGDTSLTNAFHLVALDSLNPRFVANPGQTTMDYTFWFDIYDGNGNPVTSGMSSWTRNCRGASAYVTSGSQPTATVKTAPTYDAVAGHWKVTWTLLAPGKYGITLYGTKGNVVRTGYVINFAASSAFTMLGDVTPPAEVTGLAGTASDNRVSMSWTNPGDSDFGGVLMLRNTVPITQTPVKGQVYSVDGLSGPSTIGTSRVVYYGNGASLVDGDPCTPSKRLINGTTYYYKAFTFDQPSTLNYSAGAQISGTPSDTTPPAAASNPGFTEGNLRNTVTWTNPTDCDFAGVTVRYRTDGAFPTAVDGSDGSLLAGTKAGGAPGQPDTFIHTNLTNGTPYYYTIWTYDDEAARNYGASASPAMYAVPHDTTAPSAISDLQVVSGSVGAFDVTLKWTATGDDGNTGNATKYDIRYFDQPVTEANWNQAWHTVGAQPPQPTPSGSVQSYKVSGLSPLTKYYFAIKVADEVPNWGGVSTGVGGGGVTATTLCNPELSACNQCHLLPPDDDLPGAHPRGTGNIGAHYLPIHAGDGTTPEQCGVCHADGQVWRNNTTLYAFNHQNDHIDMNGPGMIGNEYERSTKTGGTLTMFTTVVYKYKNYSSGIGYKVTTGYCSNTYCHGQGLSSPRWGLDHIVCGEYCHETPPATGRHVKHYHPGQYYINFGLSGTQVSGYANDNGSSGWTGAVTAVNRTGADGNRDPRYASFIESSNATKTFTLPNGTYYVTVCVGDSKTPLTGQTVQMSGDGGTTWQNLDGLNNWETTSQKMFKKAVDQQVLVTGGHNLLIKIGNGSVPTALNFMIVNATPEAPKANTTLLQNTPSEYGFACGKCHVADITQAKHTSHVAGPVQRGVRDAEIAFDGNSYPKNPFGVYTQVAFEPISSNVDGQGFVYTTGRSCVNLYCHGTTLHAGGSNNSPIWHDGYVDVNGASLCGACHDAGYADTTLLTNITTGSHKKHTNNDFAYKFDCYKCHNHTVGPKDPATGKIPITDKTHHVNGDVDVVFDPNDNSMKFGRYSTAVKTCESVYCHSNGLLSKNNEPFWATTYAQPVWASGSKTCNYCHGNGRSDGMPHYTNTTSTPNSHSMHVETNRQSCSKCHYNTVRNGLTIVTSVHPGAHVDGTASVVFDPENPSGSYNHSNYQCSNTYCHGRMAPPTWGGVVDCGSCHGQSPTNPNPGVGAHNMHNNGAFSIVSGVITNNSNATTYDFSCRFCHYIRVHAGGEAIPGAQTAEVNFNSVNVNNAYNNAGGVYSRGAAETDANGWHYSAGTCQSVICHSDGRGGVPNTFLTWTSHEPADCTGCHNGDDSATRHMSTGAHSKHIWSNVYRKGCNECHGATVGSSRSIINKANHVNGSVDVSVSGWNSGSETCGNVACHSNGDPSAWGNGAVYYANVNWATDTTTCTSCHSGNHVIGGDGIRTEAQTLSFNHREHLNPYNDPNLKGYGSRIGCTNCHNSTAASNTTLQPDLPTTHNDGNKDISYYVTFFNMSGPNTPAAGGVTGAYWGTYGTPAAGSCTVICHSDGRGGNPVRFPNWSTTEGTYGCGSCHPADAATFALPAYTTANAHATHLSNSVTCNICHRLTAASSTMINASGFTVHHVNGTADVKIDLSKGSGGTPTYDGATKTCSNLSCHGNRVWTQHYAANCTSCHDAPPRYSQHFGHYSAVALGNLTGVKSNAAVNKSTATNYEFGCGYCHANNSHNGGNVSTYQTAEVHFDASVSNALTKYTTAGALYGTDTRGKTYTAGTCGNVYCHSNGQTGALAKYSSISWSTTSVTCTSCHGGAAAKATVTLSAPHGTHVGTDVASGAYNFACIRCHDATVSSNTAIAYKFNHVNGRKDVSFQTFGNLTGGYDTTAQTCRNTYCHSDGNGTSKVQTWNSTPTTCSSCHDYKAPYISTNKHSQHVNNGNLASFRCSECHDMTVNASDAVQYSLGRHVNGVKDVYFSGFNGYTGGYNGTAKTCRNNYCHSSGQASSGTLGNISTPRFRTVGAWNSATAYDCKACHGADTGTGTFASQFGEPNYANRSTVSKAWYNGHGLAGHVISASDCSKCHYGVATVSTSGGFANITSGGLHINGSRNVAFRPDIGGTYDPVTKRCTNTVCHGATSVRWGGRLPNDCQSCHSDMGAGTYATHGFTGKHLKHTDSATYRFACEECHATKNTGTDIHHATGNVSANQAAEIVFYNNTASSPWGSVIYGKGGTVFRYRKMDAAYGATGIAVGYTAANSIGGTDTVGSRNWTQGRCTNVWCHSNAFDAAPVYQSFANWSTAEAVTCRSCHGGDATALPTITSYKHKAHIKNGTLGSFGCTQCHNRTVSSNSAISNYMNHVNGVKDVYFAALNTYTGFYTASRTCRDSYCHSSGQSTPAFRTTAAWNSATAYDCKACHGADSGFTSKFGEPNYANVSTADRSQFNGHYVTGHVSAASDCSKCHRGTADVLGNISTNTTKHINGSRDINFRSDIGGTYDAVNKRCTNVSCHSGLTMRWGGVGTCETCHLVTTTETDNFNYGDSIAATINFDQWTSVGHGKKGAYRYSNNPGANLGCTACHTAATPHNTASNPFRLISTNVVSTVKPSVPDTLCQQASCHASTPSNHNAANVGGSVTNWYFTPKCVDCHDPHGDNGGNDTAQHNYQMIQSYVNYSGASSSFGAPSFRRPMDFPAENPRPASKTRLSYVTSTFDGICQICHKRGTDVVGNTTNAAYFNRGRYDETTHNAGTVCTSCHSHNGGFKGAGGDCKACHNTGGSPTSAGRKDIQKSFSKRSHHINAAWTNISPRSCAMCHAEGNPDGTMNTTYHQSGKAVVLNVWNGAFTSNTGIVALLATRTFVRYTTGNGASAGLPVSAAASLNTVCLSCHNRANANATPYRASGDTSKPTVFSWENATTIEARYSNTGTTSFSKYSPSTNNVVPQIVKAFSPHGNAVANQRGKAKYGPWADDSAAGQTTKVACFDCHNSHGSRVGSYAGNTLPLTSYSSTYSGTDGGLFKEYTATNATSTLKFYMPKQDGATKNYSASSDLCFDCHLGDTTNLPNGKKFTTFGLKSTIDGYYDAGRWQATDVWKGSFAYKTAQTSGNGYGGQKGGHFGASSPLTYSTAQNINGRCVMCHDPHGVAQNGNRAYMVPALRGTWMTSPYKEDRVASQSGVTDSNSYGSYWISKKNFRPARMNPRFNYNNPPYVGGGYGKGYTPSGTDWGSGGTGADGYFIDDNTFGTNVTYGSGVNRAISDNTASVKPAQATAKHIAETPDKFAGLCLTCHSSANLQALSFSNGSTVIHVHNTVNGWYSAANAADLFKARMAGEHQMSWVTSTPDLTNDMRCTRYGSDPGPPTVMPAGYRWSVTAGTTTISSGSTYTSVPPPATANTQTTGGWKEANGFHRFPCSKCHTPHTSKLPRLMKTNCIDVGALTTPKHNTGYTYPLCDTYTGAPGSVGNQRMNMNECHNIKATNTANGHGWNIKTGW